MVRMPGGDTLQIAEAHLAAGRLPEAIAALQSAIRRQPDAARPRLMLAYAFSQSGMPDEGIRILRRLLDAFPKNADAWFNLGNLYRARHRLEDALSAFTRAAALQPDNVGVHLNITYVQVSLGRLQEAEQAARAAIARFPSEPDLLINLGQILRTTHRFGESIAVLDRCVALKPGHAGYRLTRAMVLADSGDYRRARQEADLLVGEHLEEPQARFFRAQLLLSAGDFAAGWQDYLWRPDRLRWLRAHGQAAGAPVPGYDHIRGKALVLRGEQGLGDSLFFLRFAPLLQTSEAVRVDVDPRLAAILPPRWTAGAAGPEMTLLVGDLPAILGCGVAPSLRLAAEPGRVRRIRDLLDRCGPPPYRGVTWQGGILWQDMGAPGAGLFKRVEPGPLGEVLSIVQGTWVSLQREGQEGDLEALSASAGREVHDFSWVNRDLGDALALLHQLDDYVAVSNTNVHLNEALGRSTRVLVTNPAEWRWMRDAETSPWFPESRLYRQGLNGSWEAALAQLARDLANEKGALRPLPSSN